MMGRIAGFVLRMLPVMAAAVPLVAAARLAGAYRLKNHGLTTTLRHEAGLWAFLLFLVGLAAVTILPPGGQFIPPSWSRVNLRPLVVLADSLAAMRAGDGMYFVINVLGNILMFLPLGFFPCLLWGEGKNGLLRGAGAALLASLCVEFCQLFQPRGDGEAAPVGHAAEKHVEVSDAVLHPLAEIAVGHGHLIKVKQHGQVQLLLAFHSSTLLGFFT